ncbi:MAG: GAF domain-containing sensor histidine kinase [Acidimicrobiales bacterium]|nr:GAF domain-containing sensor histidine kinase [Acidimicrobiales bacterium]RZV45959.1 MAG: hypothetical protein EX269_08510 [Acidimicrobiales bacterium]
MEDPYIPELSADEAEHLRQRRTSRPRALPRIVGESDSTGLTGVDTEGVRQAPDSIEVFQNVISVIRWGVLGLTIVLAIPDIVNGDIRLAVISSALLALTIFRKFNPIRFDHRAAGDRALVAEVVLIVGFIAVTGVWLSPFAFALATPIVVAGFARGHSYATRVAGIAALLPSALDLWLNGVNTLVAQEIVQWSLVLIVVGLVAGQARRISGEADRQHSIALSQLERLTDANSLLYSLHRVAQTLPASLDLNDVLDTTMGRLRGLFSYDAVALLIFDETDASWQVMRSEGTDLKLRLGPTMLPNPLKTAIAQNRLVDIADLSATGTIGLSKNASSGLYATLSARGQIIGLIAMEHSETGHYDERTIQMFNGFVDPVALAVDNARWFGRLRTMGADEERTRIARDLHDRIGQSMAFLAFELDRLIKGHERGDVIDEPLHRLRADVRTVIGEIRDTLSDLRTDVSDGKGFEETIEDFAARLADRSGLTIGVDMSAPARLPIMQERELWRIAQEAMVNVERHAEATTLNVKWISDGTTGVLEISDDGRGFTLGESGRIDSYGLVGMRERAASIGASMEVESAPETGTTIRCVVMAHPGRDTLAA